jgi:hypothetical protein
MLAIVKIERQGTGAVFPVNLVANCTPLERRRSSGSLIVVAAQNANLALVGERRSRSWGETPPEFNLPTPDHLARAVRGRRHTEQYEEPGKGRDADDHRRQQGAAFPAKEIAGEIRLR